MKKKQNLLTVLICIFGLLLGTTLFVSFSNQTDVQEVIVKSITPVYDETSGVIVDNENVVFNDKNQVVDYKVVIENTQDYDVQITDIQLSTPTEEFLDYKVEGIEKNEVLSANSTKELTVSFETMRVEGWGRNFADELIANISFEKYIKPPEAPATDIEELINNSTEIEIGNITNNDIEISNDIDVKDGDEVEAWIYPDKDNLGFHEIEKTDDSTKIIGIVDTIKDSEVDPGEHSIALKREEETLGYIDIYIDEDKKISKEIPKEEETLPENKPSEENPKEELPTGEESKEENPNVEEQPKEEDNKTTEENVSNKDEAPENEEILPPNTSDKGLLVILIVATTITGISIIIVSKNKFTKYSILVMLLSSTLTITKAEVLMELPLTFNINFESQNIMQPARINNKYHSFWEHREKIKNFYIKNEIKEINEYAYKFDVTEAQNNRVVAYLVTNQENSEYYDLYLQADGIIYLNKNASYYFNGMKELELIDNINGIDTSNVTTMEFMFANAGYNSETFNLDLSSFDTSNVTNMWQTFSSTGYNSKVFTLDVSNFNTSNVTNMCAMFWNTGYNSEIFTLDVSNFDTSKVTTMALMFSGTGYNSKVFTLDVSNFDTGNVKSMESMFSFAGLNSENFTLDVSNFDTSEVTSMALMFSGTGYNSKVFALDVSNFDTSNVTSMQRMFENAGFNNKNFSLDVSNFDTGNVTDMGRMFQAAGHNSTNFTLDISNFDTSKVTNMAEMFENTGHESESLTINVSGLDASNVVSMAKMFWRTGYNSTSITLNLSNFDTSNVTNMSYMFTLAGYNSESFTLDLTGFNTSNVTDMSGMFSNIGYKSKNLSLDLSGFNTGKVKKMGGMFNSVGNNSENFELDLSSFDTSNVTDMSGMFENTGGNSKNLVLDLSSFDTSNVTNMSSMFKAAGQNSEKFDLNLSNFDTSSVTNMNSMFRYTARYSENFTLDVSNFDTSSATDMSCMFDEAGKSSTKLNTSITIRNPNLTNYSGMFAASVLREGSQIKVNYTSETEELVDNIIATKYANSHVVKGNLIVDVDNLAIGDEIHISGEKFNVISQTDDTITIFAQYNLGTDYRQSSSQNSVRFANTNGWEYTPGPKEIDIQTWSTNPKNYVNAYVEYLKEELGDDTVTGDLITLKDLEALGCTIPSDYASGSGGWNCHDSPYGWLANDQYWWTRSAYSGHSTSVWFVWPGGRLENTDSKYSSRGVRPVITISKETLKGL